MRHALWVKLRRAGRVVAQAARRVSGQTRTPLHASSASATRAPRAQATRPSVKTAPLENSHLGAAKSVPNASVHPGISAMCARLQPTSAARARKAKSPQVTVACAKSAFVQAVWNVVLAKGRAQSVTRGSFRSRVLQHAKRATRGSLPHAAANPAVLVREATSPFRGPRSAPRVPSVKRSPKKTKAAAFRVTSVQRSLKKGKAVATRARANQVAASP